MQPLAVALHLKNGRDHMTNQTQLSRHLSALKQPPPPQITGTGKGTTIPTPIRWQVLSGMLKGYDKGTADFLIDGFRNGFKINFQGSREGSESPNLKSANDFPEIITAKIK